VRQGGTAPRRAQCRRRAQRVGHRSTATARQAASHRVRRDPRGWGPLGTRETGPPAGRNRYWRSRSDAARRPEGNPPEQRRPRTDRHDRPRRRAATLSAVHRL